jgi:hypothetical protein
LARARTGTTAIAAFCYSVSCLRAGSESRKSKRDTSDGAGEKWWRHARGGEKEGKVGAESGRDDGGGLLRGVRDVREHARRWRLGSKVWVTVNRQYRLMESRTMNGKIKRGRLLLSFFIVL